MESDTFVKTIDADGVEHSTGTIGKGGGPIRRPFGELGGGQIFWIGDNRSKIHKKLETPTTPEGNTAKWRDGHAKGEVVWTYVSISDDTEVEIPTK